MTKRAGKIYVGRATLGAVVGGVAGRIILPKFHYGEGTEWLFFLLYTLYTIPLAGIVGAGIGALVWKASDWAKRDMGPVSSAIIGGILISSLFALWEYPRYVGIQRSIMGLADVVYAAFLGILMGAGAGVSAGMLNRTEPE